MLSLLENTAPGWLLGSKSPKNRGLDHSPRHWTVNVILQAVLTPILCSSWLHDLSFMQ